MFFEKGTWKLFRESDHACVDLDPIVPQGQGFYSLVLHQGSTFVWQGRETEGIDAEELFEPPVPDDVPTDDEAAELDGDPLGQTEELAAIQAAELAALDEPDEEARDADECWVGW